MVDTTTPRARTDTLAAPPTPLAGLTSLLTTLGGKTATTTTNAGETEALRQALSGLQGTDYNAMLQSIFQKASADIPQLQSRLGNAIGARSGSNSAMAASLQQLLKDTTMQAQEKIAAQQLQNLTAQIQAGNAIAQTTKGTNTTTTEKANIGKGAGDIAKITALLTLLNQGTKLTGQGNLGQAIDKLTGGLISPAVTGQQPAAAPITQAATPIASPAAITPASISSAVPFVAPEVVVGEGIPTPEVNAVPIAPVFTADSPESTAAPDEVEAPEINLEEVDYPTNY